MKRVKMFFVSAALLLMTVGVFSFKAKKFTFDVYAYNALSGTYKQLIVGAGSLDGVNFTTSSSGNAQAQVTDKNGTTFPIYQGASTATPIYVATVF